MLDTTEVTRLALSFLSANLAFAPAASGQGPLFAELHTRTLWIGQPAVTTLVVATADVDGDGDRDVVAGIDSVGLFGWHRNRLLLNDGNGVFVDVSATHMPPSPEITTDIALGDVDGDGDVDLLIGNTGVLLRQNQLFLNDGSGVYTDASATHLPSHSEDTGALALDDLDGDGDLDALIANTWNTGVCRLYLNGGNGVFTDVSGTHFPFGAGSTTALELGDLDGDGDLDAMLAEALYQNDGAGVFAQAQVPWIPGCPYSDVAFGDVDGDGDLDMFVGQGVVCSSIPGGGCCTPQSSLLLNDGSGVFTDVSATHLPPSQESTGTVAMGDFDGDGDLDVLTATRMYSNDGTGTFTDASGRLPAGYGVGAFAVADVDGDADLDVAASWGNGRLFLNLTRHLAWSTPPRIGRPLVLDIYGSPGGGWLLAGSFGTVRSPLPPLGIFRLDPGSAVLDGAGVLDGSGRASVVRLVPGNPALVGFSVYWQALVSRPWQLTNLEVTTFGL